MARSTLSFLAPLALLLACDPTVAGKNDVLRFRYAADDNVLPTALTTPIAAGFAADVEVRIDPAGAAERNSNVIDASSDDPAVVDVVATAGNVITLLAKRAGRAEIAVRSVDGEDAFDVSVVEVTKFDLSHPGILVSDNPPSKGLVGGTARFIVQMKDAANKTAIGLGPVPVTVDPVGALVAEDSTEAGFVPVRFNAVGTATLTAQGDDALTVEVVAVADVVDLAMTGPDTVHSLLVGTDLTAVLRGITTQNEKVVGVASLANVSATPAAVCTITPTPGVGEGAFLIEAVAAGTCTVTASLGDRVATYDVTVEARP